MCKSCVRDGDTVSIKGIYSEEANKELEEKLNNRAHYIGLNGITDMTATAQAISAMYLLTLEVPGMKKCGKPIF